MTEPYVEEPTQVTVGETIIIDYGAGERNSGLPDAEADADPWGPEVQS